MHKSRRSVYRHNDAALQIQRPMDYHENVPRLVNRRVTPRNQMAHRQH